MNMYQKWLSIKEIIRQQTEDLHEIEGSIWLDAEKNGNLNLLGGKTYEDDGYKITITHGESIKVDQKQAELRPDLFRTEYKFDKTQYKNLVDSQKEIVDEAITITKAKPQFKMERL